MLIECGFSKGGQICIIKTCVSQNETGSAVGCIELELLLYI